MTIPDRYQRFVLAIPLAGGVMVIIGWLVTRTAQADFFSGTFMNLESWAVGAMGLVMVALGVLLFGATTQGDAGRLALGVLVAAAVAFALELNMRLALDALHAGLGSWLIFGGSIVAAASGSLLIARDIKDAGRAIPRSAALVMVGGGLMAVIGSFLNWVSDFGGLDIEPGKYALGLGIGVVVIGAFAYAFAGRKAGALIITGGTGTALVAASFAIDVGVFIDPAPVEIGVYVVIVGSVLAAAFGFAAVTEAVGSPRPSFPTWVGVVFSAIGALALGIGLLAIDRLEDLEASVFMMRLNGSLLLLTGIGLLAQQRWAWYLGLPLSVMGIVNGALTLFVGAGSVGFLAVVIYGNALAALWRSRGIEVPPSEAIPVPLVPEPTHIPKPMPPGRPTGHEVAISLRPAPPTPSVLTSIPSEAHEPEGAVATRADGRVATATVPPVTVVDRRAAATAAPPAPKSEMPMARLVEPTAERVGIPPATWPQTVAPSARPARPRPSWMPWLLVALGVIVVAILAFALGRSSDDVTPSQVDSEVPAVPADDAAPDDVPVPDENAVTVPQLPAELASAAATPIDTRIGSLLVTDATLKKKACPPPIIPGDCDVAAGNDRYLVVVFESASGAELSMDEAFTTKALRSTVVTDDGSEAVASRISLYDNEIQMVFGTLPVSVAEGRVALYWPGESPLELDIETT